MILRILSLVILLAAPSMADPSVDFDGTIYTQAASIERDGVRLDEFTRAGEDLSDWTTLVSVQTHPNAHRVSDVMNPYAAARQRLYAADPQIFQKNDSKHDEDLIFEFLLLAPDQSHFEFVLLRAFSDEEKPVTLYVFSKRIMLSDQEKAESELAQIKNKRSDWFRSLNRFSISGDETPTTINTYQAPVVNRQ